MRRRGSKESEQRRQTTWAQRWWTPRSYRARPSHGRGRCGQPPSTRPRAYSIRSCEGGQISDEARWKKGGGPRQACGSGTSPCHPCCSARASAKVPGQVLSMAQRSTGANHLLVVAQNAARAEVLKPPDGGILAVTTKVGDDLVPLLVPRERRAAAGLPRGAVHGEVLLCIVSCQLPCFCTAMLCVHVKEGLCQQPW